MPSLEVLAVDDDPIQLELMTQYLADIDPDLRITKAMTHSEAFERIRNYKYDCIVLDQSMPEGTGLDLAKRIREISRTPIILYTGYGSEELASKSRDYGVDDYLRKDSDPAHYETLVKRIRKSAERHSLEEMARSQFFPEEKLRLPEYPKVDVRGRSIYIVYEDGSEELWGMENRRSIALNTAKELELGLRAIKYGKDYLTKSMNELMYDLMELGIPVEYVDSIIEKGYKDLTKLLAILADEKSFSD
jgi:CheY-like chemotaxis protein